MAPVLSLRTLKYAKGSVRICSNFRRKDKKKNMNAFTWDGNTQVSPLTHTHKLSYEKS